MDIVLVLAALASIVVLVAAFVALRLARTRHTPTTHTTNTTPQHALDPELLAVLETLPENQARLLKRMLHSHARLERNTTGTPVGTPMAATNVVQQAVPLAQESARLESYLARHDLERVVRNAATDPTARPLAEDLMRMADRADQLLETLEDAAQQLELEPAPSPEALTALADKLKLF